MSFTTAAALSRIEALEKKLVVLEQAHKLLAEAMFGIMEAIDLAVSKVEPNPAEGLPNPAIEK